MLAAQNHVSPSRNDKIVIMSEEECRKCRMRGYRDKTVTDLTSECEKFAKCEVNKRPDWVASIIHPSRRVHYKFKRSKKLTWPLYSEIVILSLTEQLKRENQILYVLINMTGRQLSLT